MKLERAVALCLALSLLLHAALVAFGALVVMPWPHQPDGPSVMNAAPAADTWAGETFDIDTSLASAAGQDEPHGVAPGNPQPKPEPEPRETKPADPKPAEPTPPALPKAAPDEPAEPPEPAEPAKPAEPTPPPSQPEPDAHSKPPSPKPSSSAKPPSREEPKPAAPPASAPALAASAVGTPPGAVASASPSGSGRRPGSSGSFGAAGRRRGVRNLATAFARAMPIANSGDPVWSSLPLGPAGRVDITLEVGDDGKIAGAKPVDAGSAPPHLVRLVQNTLTLLRAGRFALTTQDSAGAETYRLEATIDQVDAAPADDPSSAGPYALGFKPPQLGTPGHATFTLRSGRRITIKVTLLEP